MFIKFILLYKKKSLFNFFNSSCLYWQVIQYYWPDNTFSFIVYFLSKQFICYTVALSITDQHYVNKCNTYYTYKK